MTSRLFIVIPTRNRHDTLRHALRTALQQDASDLTVIVSDNHSSPDTREVVAEFSDNRLRYQRADRPLSMMDSWEFALSGVEGEGLVHFMGDDNGLLPDATCRVTEAADATGLEIVHGDVVQYHWPAPERPAHLAMPTKNGGSIVSAVKSRAAVYRQWLGFDRLPTINVAFVHTRVIARVKARVGRYFAASNPDVFSAAANAMVVQNYVYLHRPFMINGASRHSNGAAGATGMSPFVQDTLAGGYRYHRSFPPARSYYFNVYEALAVAADNFPEVDLPRLDMPRIMRRAIRNEFAEGRHWLKEEIEEFARLNQLSMPSFPELRAIAETKPEPLLAARIDDKLVFATDAIPLENVYDASQFAHHQLQQLATADAYRSAPAKVRLKAAVRDRLMGAQRLSRTLLSATAA